MATKKQQSSDVEETKPTSEPKGPQELEEAIANNAGAGLHPELLKEPTTVATMSLEPVAEIEIEPLDRLVMAMVDVIDGDKSLQEFRTLVRELMPTSPEALQLFIRKLSVLAQLGAVVTEVAQEVVGGMQGH